MRSLVGDLVLVRLQEERDPLLHKRLYNALRRAILDGSLAPQICSFSLQNIHITNKTKPV